uniref:Uncharacterized protein n=1 Tax=Anguilla anguilla TaxID=7936 RepID=A0A0E9SDU2_ANGAN
MVIHTYTRTHTHTHAHTSSSLIVVLEYNVGKHIQIRNVF